MNRTKHLVDAYAVSQCRTNKGNTVIKYAFVLSVKGVKGILLLDVINFFNEKISHTFNDRWYGWFMQSVFAASKIINSNTDAANFFVIGAWVM